MNSQTLRQKEPSTGKVEGPSTKTGSILSKTSPESKGILEAALFFAGQGFSIFPTGKDKRPLLKWEKYQKERATPDQIREWWVKFPDANIGIVTGAISGIVVVDIDTAEGHDEIQKYIPESLETPTASTPKGGKHLLFKSPKIELRNNCRTIPGCDYRGAGGYILAAPSVGANGKKYEWLISPQEVPFAELPQAYINEVNKPAKAKPKTITEEMFTEGRRDNDLFHIANVMSKGGAPAEEINQVLLKLMSSWGERDESWAIAKSQSAIDRIARKEQTEEPSPLPEGLPPVKALDPDMIPAPLRGWLMDISDRMQIPPDFSTAAAVVAAGSIIGRGCGIYPKRHDDWLVIANLWGAVIGRPSLMKTPAITEAQRPLVRLETEARDKYTEEAHAAETDKEIEKITRAAICENIKKAVKTGDTAAIEQARERLSEVGSEETTRRRYQTQDGTTEKIGELLIQNPRGLLVNRDELIGWYRSLDKPGREGDRAFFLEAWNGSRGYTYDRIGRGTLDIDALCVSIFGAITPGPLSDYVYQASRGGNGDDGLLQRFQVMVWPDAPSEWKNIDRFPDSKEKERAWEIFSKLALDGLGSSVVGQYTGEIPALRFSPSGQEIFDAWRHNLEIRLRSDHGLPPSLESHLAKYRSLMPSLSLIFHLVEVVDGKATGAISETAALMAAAWCDYLESHAMRVYGGATMPGMESAREIAKHIRRGAITDGCKPKDIYRNQWSRLATPEEVKAGLDVLSEYDWLIIEKINTGGRPSEIVRLNPGLKV